MTVDLTEKERSLIVIALWIAKGIWEKDMNESKETHPRLGRHFCEKVLQAKDLMKKLEY